MRVRVWAWARVRARVWVWVWARVRVRVMKSYRTPHTLCSNPEPSDRAPGEPPRQLWFRYCEHKIAPCLDWAGAATPDGEHINVLKFSQVPTTYYLL